MSTSSPYFRTFTFGAMCFGAVALKMVSRHPGHWSTYPPRNLIVLLLAWVITALLLGVVAKQFEKFRSWWALGLGTMAGWMLVLWLMLQLAVLRANESTGVPKFKSTDEMMSYLAREISKWVKQDRGIDLDYSLQSIRIVEEELGRVSKEVNKANPKPGTFGIALGYGAYIGEVFRRHDGGSWAVDHPVGGPQSYPLTTKSNNVVFPVGWCWKRLINGEEDNVYIKAMAFADVGSLITNAPDVR